jgi:predicted Holliday junction resolvase-like endonuclease
MTQVLALILFIFAAIYTIYKSSKVQKVERRDHEDLAEANQIIGDLSSRVLEYTSQIRALKEQVAQQSADFQKLQHQKISADVKLGQRYENILPFMEKFPYKDDEIRGLFNPIDLVVFRDEEVVFIEIKTGAAQLSEKQRKIRDNIKAGRVKFEVHRMDENGVKIK